jgi:hypothetical protein
MTPADFQTWLNAHGAGLIVDGKPGALTRAAIITVFSNDCAAAIDDAGIEALATRLGCTAKQIRAVSRVESGGAAFDDTGRPKILFERHLFHRATNGRFTPSVFSNPNGGGYNVDSWEKLTLAACKDVDAAFASVSWGKFQVLGKHWQALGYPSPLEMAYSSVTSEAAHYEMLARYIEKNNLKAALAKLSTNAADNVAFAKGYNGPAFKKFAYDTKLSAAMK